MRRFCMLLLALLVCFATPGPVVLAHSAIAQADGQDYIVKRGDTLVKISLAIYGQASGWRAIFEATNAKAASDPSYAHITNPNVIQVGQKLWIPANAASGTPTNENALNEAYGRSVKDAETAESGEISRNLVAITDTEPGLVWKPSSDQKKVLMVTWTSFAGYNDKVGQSTKLDANRVVWVTAAPFVRDFCQAYTHDKPNADLTLRLRQLLGLPLKDGKTTFVEFWVSPQDMFRPSPDPEITDHEAELNFRNTNAISTTAAYRAWFNQLQEASYVPPGYPWTRLGYTYDWGNPASEIGMSEFVINDGAVLDVAAVYSTQDYCK